jgi:hypothetical protein
MKTLGNTVIQEDDIEFIRAGLGSVSGMGRRALKDIAQTLAAAQNRRAIVQQAREGRTKSKGTSEKE